MATPTMQAAVTTQWNAIQTQARPVPDPGPGQVRLRTLLAGICGSDVHIYQGHHPTAASPIVQGHELVGVVDSLGSGCPDHLKPGMRVVVEPLISCGVCEACRRGQVHVCRKLKLLGIHEHGAFAEYLLAPAGKIIPVPGHLPDRYAVLAEPFAVGVHVCARAAMEPATRALVIGAGPIGLIVAMVARACGVKVAVSEISPDRQSTVTESGFDLIDAGNQPEQQAAELTNGDGFDTVFEVSGSKPGLGLAIEAARVRGTIVQVGFYSSPPEADLFKFTFKELHLVGSRVYRHEDFRRAVQLLDTLSKQEPALLDQLISETVDLGGVESAIRRMIAGEVAGKIVVNPGEGS